MYVTSMRETCIDCGTSWGVTMTPRTVVRCTPCATPKPWKWPLWYWETRVANFHPDRYAIYRSPEWWDAQTSRKDLAAAIEFARALPEGRSTVPRQNAINIVSEHPALAAEVDLRWVDDATLTVGMRMEQMIDLCVAVLRERGYTVNTCERNPQGRAS